MIDRLNAALVDRYQMLEQIGEGGMATVFLADDLKHERKVALKVLKPELAAVVGAERFLAEIKTTANLQHPHILPLHDSGTADGLLYYVMPYVDGEALSTRLEREKRLSIELDAAADLRAPRQEAQDGHGRLCLAGARLADKANRFATLDENIDAVDNDILAVAYGQAGDIEQTHDDFLASK